jgi:hypothetical protein
MYIGLQTGKVPVGYSCPVLMTLESSPKIFEKLSNIKFL